MKEKKVIGYLVNGANIIVTKVIDDFETYYENPCIINIEQNDDNGTNISFAPIVIFNNSGRTLTFNEDLALLSFEPDSGLVQIYKETIEKINSCEKMEFKSLETNN